jgi:hypothetical protein
VAQEKSRNNRNRHTKSTVIQDRAPIQEAECESGSELDEHHGENIEMMEDQMENPMNVADGDDAERANHARELRRALDLIRRMTADDFFDPTEESAGVAEEYDRMDWLYEEMDADYADRMDGAEEQEDLEEDNQADDTNKDEWYPFKNKMVSQTNPHIF